MAAPRLMGDYEVGATLGSGLQGKVKLGRHVRTHELVALKIIDLENISPRELHNLRREIRSMEKIDPPHPNCVGLRHIDDRAIYPKKNGSTKEVILLVLELAQGGELFDFLMYTGQFPQEIAFQYFRQLLSALATCHRHGVYHRDLKPENLLLDQSFNLKVADFGLSALDEDAGGAPIEGSRAWLRTECGTRGYMAPEVLAHQSYNGDKADVWSAGVVLFIMLGGFPPFQQATLNDWWFKAVTFKNYAAFWQAHERTARFSDRAKALLNKVFVADPEERPTVQELLDDPLLRDQGEMAPDMFKAELLRRKRAVDVEKHRQREEERLEKLQRQREEAKEHGEGKDGDEFDPFEQDIMRSASASTSADVGALASVLKQPKLDAAAGAEDALIDAMPPPTPWVLHSRLPARALQSRIQQALTAMKATVKPQKTDKAGDSSGSAANMYKTKATVVLPTGMVSFSTEVLRLAEDARAPHVVQVRRRAGDALTFKKLFQTLSEDMADVLCGDPTLTEAAAAATPSAGGGEGEGSRGAAGDSAGPSGGSVNTIFSGATADSAANVDGDDAEEDVADEVVDPFISGST